MVLDTGVPSQGQITPIPHKANAVSLEPATPSETLEYTTEKWNIYAHPSKVQQIMTNLKEGETKWLGKLLLKTSLSEIHQN